MDNDDVLYFVGYAHGYRGDFLSAKPGPLRQGWEDGSGDRSNGFPPDSMFDCRAHYNRLESEVTVTCIRNPLVEELGEYTSHIWILGTHEHSKYSVYTRNQTTGTSWVCVKNYE